MASLVGVQPLARGGLGLRLSRPPASPCRCSRSPIPTPPLAEVDSLLERGARMVHIRPAPVPGTQRHRPVARRPAARPGVGASRRGVDPGRVPPRRQRLQRRSPPRGARARRSRFGNSDALSRSPRVRPRRSTTRWRALVVARRVQPAPGAAGREHRERLRLAPRCSSSACASRRNQTPWVFARGSARHGAPPRVGDAVPRGGPRRAGRPRSASSASCSAPTGRTAKGLAQPLDFLEELERLRRGRREQRIMRDNCRRAARAGP